MVRVRGIYMGAVGNGDTDLNISHEPGGPSASGRVMF